MEALIGTAVVIVLALTGGTMAFIRRRGKSSYKAGEQRGTVDSKLDIVIERQGAITTKVDKMATEIREKSGEVLREVEKKISEILNDEQKQLYGELVGGGK